MRKAIRLAKAGRTQLAFEHHVHAWTAPARVPEEQRTDAVWRAMMGRSQRSWDLLKATQVVRRAWESGRHLSAMCA
jgi:hypothetical protein